MANAEKLIQDAQFAFQSISFGDSPANKKNTRKASSLCRKIIAKYPGSKEASEAHAILRRLGEEAYASKLAARHIHQPSSSQHTPHRQPQSAQRQSRSQTTSRMQRTAAGDELEALEWGALLGFIFSIPKFILWMLAVGAFFLFGLFGPFIFVPLIVFVLFTGPFRKSLNQAQREKMNILIRKINDQLKPDRDKMSGN